MSKRISSTKLRSNLRKDTKKDFFENRTMHNIHTQITFSTDDYSYTRELAPNIAFFKFLARRSNSTALRLCLAVPDTLVFNESMIPVWIYTGLDGFLYRTETFHDQLILGRLGVIDNPYEVVSVVKRPVWSSVFKRYHGLNTCVLNSTDLKSRMNEFLSGEMCAVQRFIKSKGPVSFVCRVVYRRNKKNTIFVISNKTSFKNEKEDPRKRCLTSSTDMENCNVIISSNGKYLEDTLPQVKRIVAYLESNLGVEVTEFAGDFIKDDNDNWWFVTCKAFQFKGTAETKGFIVDRPYWSSDESQDEEKAALKTEYNRLKRCRLCQVYYPMTLLPHQLTIKMITETDQHLRERGVMIQWLDRAEYRHSGHATIYQNYRVCSDCYSLYELTEELKEIQRVLSEAFSIPLKVKEVDMGKMPADWNFESKQAVLINSDKPKTVIDETRESKPMKLFRMLIILLDFNEPRPYLNGTYELQFSNFDLNQSYKLDFQGGQKVSIEKLKMYQFFVNSRNEFKNYLNENHLITITLSRNGEVIGKTDLEIIDFLSPIVKHKSFYKVLSSSATILGYLNCKVAIEEEEYIDVTNIPLRNHSGIFIPPEDFLLCLPLPNEWFEIFPSFEQVACITIPSNHFVLKPPSRPRAQSAKPKKINRPLSRTAIVSRPRSCTVRDKKWKVVIEIHTVNGITDTIEPWIVFFSVFGERYMKEEATRSDVFVYFKTKTEIFIKGSDEEVEKTLINEKVEVRMTCGKEIGQSFIPLDGTKGKKNVNGIVNVEFPNRNSVFLEYNISVFETILQDFELGKVLNSGVAIMKSGKNGKVF